MAEQPGREQQHDHRQRERHTAEEPAEGVRIERDRDRIVRIEPLDDRADDGHQQNQERDAVAPLLLGERLLAQQPERATRRMREAEPGGSQRPRSTGSPRRGNFFVGAGRPRDPARGLLQERDELRVDVAMRSRYRRHPRFPGIVPACLLLLV